MQVRVLFFGMLRDVVGTAEEQVQLEEESSVGLLYGLYARRFPALERHSGSLLFSRNREFVGRSQKLSDGDEVAFLPPVSGGVSRSAEASALAAQTAVCRLTRDPIDVTALVRELKQEQDGAVVVFEGVVRSHSGGRPTLFLEYHAYESMALQKMGEICQSVYTQFGMDRVGIVHRLGRLEVGETSVAIVVVAAHRRLTFDACREAIDQLKRIVPIWKKEVFADGSAWAVGESAWDERPSGR
jgi:molybdopterin synthase catalytic subunit